MLLLKDDHQYLLYRGKCYFDYIVVTERYYFFFCGIDLCTECLHHLLTLADKENTLEVKCPQCLKLLQYDYLRVPVSAVRDWFYSRGASVHGRNVDNNHNIVSPKDMAIEYIRVTNSKSDNPSEDITLWTDHKIISYIHNARNEELQPIGDKLHQFEVETIDVQERVEDDELPVVQTELSSKLSSKVTTSLGLSPSRTYSERIITEKHNKTFERSHTSPPHQTEFCACDTKKHQKERKARVCVKSHNDDLNPPSTFPVGMGFWHYQFSSEEEEDDYAEDDDDENTNDGDGDRDHKVQNKGKQVMQRYTPSLSAMTEDGDFLSSPRRNSYGSAHSEGY
ncbi:hypothetical protein RFI_08947, partial [Reticulomyxa filosa]